jgi:Leucine-rich repeat (LRR) protein
MTFVNSKKIQVIDISNNGLREFAPDTFRTIDDLRIVDLSSNYLRFLPDTSFSRCRLEKIDLSNNQFTRIPSNGFSNLATMDLVDLDLSNNLIGMMNSRELRYFSVSRMFEIQIFACLYRTKQMAPYQ